MGAQLSQFFPPSPAFTDADVGPQDGKVFIVTGGSSGIGLELARMLYAKGARVYIAGRSEAKARQAISDIRAATTTAAGTTAAAAGTGTGTAALEFLHLELDDLASIKGSAEAFAARESRLDVLWNNAGVSRPPAGSASRQGHELQLAANCLGPFLLTQLLAPLLDAAGAAGGSAPARVVWAGSQVVELSAPPQGIVMSEVRSPPQRDGTRGYVNSKTGNLFLATELARRRGGVGGAGAAVLSVALNPGAASTNLLRHTPWAAYLAWPLLHEAKLAAYTELYAGLSGDITLERNGCYVVPWGRVLDWKLMRADLVEATKLEGDGGSGRAKEFWELCEEKTRDYA